MEERVLGGVFTPEKLDVINEENIDLAISLIKRRHLVCRDRIDVVVGEFFARHIANLHSGEESLCVVTNGMEKVCFAESRAAVDKEGVVGLGGGFADGERGRVGESVGRPDDEVVECVLGVEPGLASGNRHGGWAGGGHGNLGGDVVDFVSVTKRRIHHDREVRNRLLGKPGEGGQDIFAGPLFDHVAREIRFHLDVKGFLHHTLGDCHFDNRDQPWRDLGVTRDLIDNFVPEGFERVGHGDFLGTACG